MRITTVVGVFVSMVVACGSEESGGPAAGSSSGGSSGNGSSSGAGSSGSDGGSSGVASSSSGQGGSSGAATSDRGLVDCGGELVDVMTDARHCGACGAACTDGLACFQRECRQGLDPASCGPSRDVCDGVCQPTDYLLERCGACDVACGNDQACDQGACRPLGGGGTSCADAIELHDDNAQVFWFRHEHSFSCGTGAPQPSVFFRWTAGDSPSVSIDTRTSSDMTVEVFSTQSCGDAERLGCRDQNGGSGGRLEFEAVEGTTYFIVVGARSAETAAGRHLIRLDD